MRVTTLVREPLLHFLLLGGALFLGYRWSSGGSGPTSTRIVLPSARIEQLAAGFAKTWQHSASESELKALLDDWVREEIAVREGMAMGLDRDDTVIRRRLRQKFEFLLEDFATATPPTDEELAAWLGEHADRYRVEPRVGFRQVYLSPERRGAAAEADGRAILARLHAEHPDAEELGDPSLMPAIVPVSFVGDIARQFGGSFAERLAAAEPGRWTGPLESAHGLHLVLVTERTAGSLPPLASIRSAVERDLLADRRQRQIDRVYERLLDKYVIVVERAETTGAVAEGGGS